MLLACNIAGASIYTLYSTIVATKFYVTASHEEQALITLWLTILPIKFYSKLGGVDNICSK